MVNILSCKLQGAYTDLIEKIAFVLIIFQQNEPYLCGFDANIRYLLDLAVHSCILRFRKGEISIFKIALVFVLVEMIENVDSRGHFGGMCDYFDRFEKNGLMEGEGQKLRVVTEPLGLPMSVSWEKVGSRGGVELWGDRLYFEVQVH